MSTKVITASAGKPYGHVPGHTYCDVDIEASRGVATLTITWGSAQGYDEEHGRREYTRRGATTADAIESVRDEAMAETSRGDDEDLRGYIETAASRALLQASRRRVAA